MGTTPDPIPGHLRWRCRRGTRELDRLVSWWLTERWENADGEARAAFANMLECADPDLWNWLTGLETPDDPAVALIVDEIRAVHRV
jgi:antitoxin CptB